MKVLYFGTYERDYPRNAQVVSCLRSAGAEVAQEHRDVWRERDGWSLGGGQLARVAWAEASLALSRRRDDADVLVVGYPGHFDMPAARRVARGRPVVFNPLVSLHDTLVGDRRRFRPGSVPARAVAAVDRWAFKAADLVVADTAAHAAFFRAAFALPEERVAVCFVGAEDALFHPGPADEEPFHALFVGKLIPLHGLGVILAAARQLPHVPFRIVGSGQLRAMLDRRPANVEWVPWLAYRDVPDAYRRAGCALGAFGSSAKASRVIPNKVFQAVACACPVVTADTPAARELLRDGADALLVPAGDAAALARAIRRLADDPSLRVELGAAGRATYEARAAERVLGPRWVGMLERTRRAR